MFNPWIPQGKYLKDWLLLAWIYANTSLLMCLLWSLNVHILHVQNEQHNFNLHFPNMIQFSDVLDRWCRTSWSSPVPRSNVQSRIVCAGCTLFRLSSFHNTGSYVLRFLPSHHARNLPDFSCCGTFGTISSPSKQNVIERAWWQGHLCVNFESAISSELNEFLSILRSSISEHLRESLTNFSQLQQRPDYSSWRIIHLIRIFQRKFGPRHHETVQCSQTWSIKYTW